MSLYKSAVVIVNTCYDVYDTHKLKAYLEDGSDIKPISVTRDSAPKFRPMFEEEYIQEKSLGLAEDECAICMYTGKYVSQDEHQRALKTLTAKLKLKGFKVLDGHALLKEIV